MTTTRRDVLTGGLAQLRLCAVSTPAWAPRQEEYFLFRRHGGRQWRHLQDDQFRQDRPEVAQAGRQIFQRGAARHGRRRYAPPLPLPDHGEQDGDPLRRRRRPRRLQVVRPRHHRPQDAVAEMDAAAGDDQAPPGTAGLRRGRIAEEPAQRARHVSVPRWRRHSATACTARWSPGSIGTDASSGCIRMFPEYVIDLYQRCPIGTAVQVLPHIADQADKSKPQADPTIVE